jgi:hypothetical protein
VVTIGLPVLQVERIIKRYFLTKVKCEAARDMVLESVIFGGNMAVNQDFSDLFKLLNQEKICSIWKLWKINDKNLLV